VKDRRRIGHPSTSDCYAGPSRVLRWDFVTIQLPEPSSNRCGIELGELPPPADVSVYSLTSRGDESYSARWLLIALWDRCRRVPGARDVVIEFRVGGRSSAHAWWQASSRSGRDRQRSQTTSSRRPPSFLSMGRRPRGHGGCHRGDEASAGGFRRAGGRNDRAARREVDSDPASRGEIKSLPALGKATRAMSAGALTTTVRNGTLTWERWLEQKYLHTMRTTSREAGG